MAGDSSFAWCGATSAEDPKPSVLTGARETQMSTGMPKSKPNAPQENADAEGIISSMRRPGARSAAPKT